MAVKHTDEGKRHMAAHEADPKNIPKPPPVRADGGKGKVLDRDEMTWRDSKKKKIPYYASENGQVKRINRVARLPI
jgi:hypothetical protein